MTVLGTVGPRVLMAPSVHERLWLYIDAARQEISGLGRVVQRGNDLEVVEVFLLKQRSNGSETTLDDAAIASLIGTLGDQGIDTAELRFWWHSHGESEVYFSPQDERTINAFGAYNDWFLSMVGNRRGELRFRLDIFEPFRIPADDLAYRIRYATPGEVKRAIQAEVKENVRRPRRRKRRSPPNAGAIPAVVKTVETG